MVLSRQAERNRAGSRLPKPRLKSVFDAPFGVKKLIDYDMATYGEEWRVHRVVSALASAAHVESEGFA